MVRYRVDDRRLSRLYPVMTVNFSGKPVAEGSANLDGLSERCLEGLVQPKGLLGA